MPQESQRVEKNIRLSRFLVFAGLTITSASGCYGIRVGQGTPSSGSASARSLYEARKQGQLKTKVVLGPNGLSGTPFAACAAPELKGGTLFFGGCNPKGFHFTVGLTHTDRAENRAVRLIQDRTEKFIGPVERRSLKMSGRQVIEYRTSDAYTVSKQTSFGTAYLLRDASYPDMTWIVSGGAELTQGRGSLDGFVAQLASASEFVIDQQAVENLRRLALQRVELIADDDELSWPNLPDSWTAVNDRHDDTAKVHFRHEDDLFGEVAVVPVFHNSAGTVTVVVARHFGISLKSKEKSDFFAVVGRTFVGGRPATLFADPQRAAVVVTDADGSTQWVYLTDDRAESRMPGDAVRRLYAFLDKFSFALVDRTTEHRNLSFRLQEGHPRTPKSSRKWWGFEMIGGFKDRGHVIFYNRKDPHVVAYVGLLPKPPNKEDLRCPTGMTLIESKPEAWEILCKKDEDDTSELHWEGPLRGHEGDLLSVSIFHGPVNYEEVSLQPKFRDSALRMWLGDLKGSVRIEH